MTEHTRTHTHARAHTAALSLMGAMETTLRVNADQLSCPVTSFPGGSPAPSVEGQEVSRVCPPNPQWMRKRTDPNLGVVSS